MFEGMFAPCLTRKHMKAYINRNNLTRKAPKKRVLSPESVLNV